MVKRQVWAVIICFLLATFGLAAPAATAGASTAPSVVATVSTGPAYGIAVNTNTNMVYATNDLSNGQVYVIDGSTNQEISTISVGNTPAGIAVDPDTNTIYVANQNSDTLSVINGTNDQITATITLPFAPFGVAVDPETDTIFVDGGPSSNVVDVIDGSTNQISTTVSVGTDPQFLSFDPVTNAVYVPAFSGSSDAIDATSYAVTSISGGSVGNVWDVAINPGTNTLYTSTYSGTAPLTALNTTTNQITSYITIGSNGPYLMANDTQDGFLYVGAYSSNQVVTVDTSTNQVVGTTTLTNAAGDTQQMTINTTTGLMYVATLNGASSGSVAVLRVSSGQTTGASTPNGAQAIGTNSNATVVIGAGTLGFCSAPTNASFGSVALNGQVQIVNAHTALDVCDATGSGAGWQIDATSTQFAGSATGHALPLNSVTVVNKPQYALDAGAAGSVAAINTIAYPYSLPAGVNAPAATALASAQAGTGMGAQTVMPTFTLTIPANALADAYSSTWTFTVVTGP